METIKTNYDFDFDLIIIIIEYQKFVNLNTMSIIEYLNNSSKDGSLNTFIYHGAIINFLNDNNIKYVIQSYNF